MDPPPAEFPDVLHFWDLLEGVSDANPDVVSDDREDCLILRFTGGTTGAAKAVMYSIDNFHASRDLHYASADVIPTRGARLAALRADQPRERHRVLPDPVQGRLHDHDERSQPR